MLKIKTMAFKIVNRTSCQTPEANNIFRTEWTSYLEVVHRYFAGCCGVYNSCQYGNNRPLLYTFAELCLVVITRTDQYNSKTPTNFARIHSTDCENFWDQYSSGTVVLYPKCSNTLQPSYFALLRFFGRFWYVWCQTNRNSVKNISWNCFYWCVYICLRLITEATKRPLLAVVVRSFSSFSWICVLNTQSKF